jgi:hypothetical protein
MPNTSFPLELPKMAWQYTWSGGTDQYQSSQKDRRDGQAGIAGLPALPFGRLSAVQSM